MKNALLIVAFLIQIQALGQGLKGKFQIGGSGSYTVENDEQPNYSELTEFKNRTFSIAPQIGYFIGESISTGIALSYISTKSTLNNSSIYDFSSSNYKTRSDMNLYGIGPFIRFHKAINERFYLFLQGGLSMAFGDQKSTNSKPGFNSKSDILEFEIGIRPGLLILFSEKFGVETSFGFLGYHSFETTVLDDFRNSQPFKDESYGLDLNLRNLSVGLQYYF